MLYQQTLAIEEEVHGVEHPAVAAALTKRATLLKDQVSGKGFRCSRWFVWQQVFFVGRCSSADNLLNVADSVSFFFSISIVDHLNSDRFE